MHRAFGNKTAQMEEFSTILQSRISSHPPEASLGFLLDLGLGTGTTMAKIFDSDLNCSAS